LRSAFSFFRLRRFAILDLKECTMFDALPWCFSKLASYEVAKAE
jgi:hypothetical protein